MEQTHIFIAFSFVGLALILGVMYAFIRESLDALSEDLNATRHRVEHIQYWQAEIHRRILMIDQYLAEKQESPYTADLDPYIHPYMFMDELNAAADELKASLDEVVDSLEE